CLGPEFVAHLSEFDSRFRGQHAVRAEPLARVALHAEEIILSRRLEKYVFGVVTCAVAKMLAARHRLHVAHRKSHPDRKLARAGAQGLDAEAMRLQQDVARAGAHAKRKARKHLRLDTQRARRRSAHRRAHDGLVTMKDTRLMEVHAEVEFVDG